VAKHSGPPERVICRLDTMAHTYVLFFPNITERDGTMVSWSEGVGHGTANPQDERFAAPPYWSGAEDAMRKYEKQYRGNYALSRRQA